MKKIMTLLIFFLIYPSFSFSQSCNTDLESSFTSLPNWLNKKRKETPELVNQKCIEKAMDIYHSWTVGVANKRRANNQKVLGQFAYCKNQNSSTPTRSELPFCKTSTYLNVIQNSFNDVMDCFDLDPKLFFPMIALESGFHINSLSVIGEDIGIGQMTPIAIDHVNRNWNAMFDQIILKSNKKSCNRLMEIVSINDLSSLADQHVCSLSSLPKNPIKNLIYMGFLTSMNRNHIQDSFEKNKVIDRISSLTQVSLNNREVDKLINTLTFLSYNQGTTTALESFNSFLNEKSIDFKFIETEIEELNAAKSDIYLVAMTFKADNDTSNYNAFIKKHSDILKRIQQLSDALQEKHLSLSQFSINDIKGGFADFLIKNNISPYLSYLKERVTYIEDSLNQPSGFCSTNDYLEM